MSISREALQALEAERLEARIKQLKSEAAAKIAEKEKNTLLMHKKDEIKGIIGIGTPEEISKKVTEYLKLGGSFHDLRDLEIDRNAIREIINIGTDEETGFKPPTRSENQDMAFSFIPAFTRKIANATDLTPKHEAKDFDDIDYTLPSHVDSFSTVRNNYNKLMEGGFRIEHLNADDPLVIEKYLKAQRDPVIQAAKDGASFANLVKALGGDQQNCISKLIDALDTKERVFYGEQSIKALQRLKTEKAEEESAKQREQENQLAKVKKAAIEASQAGHLSNIAKLNKELNSFTIYSLTDAAELDKLLLHYLNKLSAEQKNAFLTDHITKLKQSGIPAEKEMGEALAKAKEEKIELDIFFVEAVKKMSYANKSELLKKYALEPLKTEQAPFKLEFGSLTDFAESDRILLYYLNQLQLLEKDTLLSDYISWLKRSPNPANKKQGEALDKEKKEAKDLNSFFLSTVKKMTLADKEELMKKYVTRGMSIAYIAERTAIREIIQQKLYATLDRFRAQGGNLSSITLEKIPEAIVIPFGNEQAATPTPAPAQPAAAAADTSLSIGNLIAYGLERDLFDEVKEAKPARRSQSAALAIVAPDLLSFDTSPKAAPQASPTADAAPLSLDALTSDMPLSFDLTLFAAPMSPPKAKSPKAAAPAPLPDSDVLADFDPIAPARAAMI